MTQSKSFGKKSFSIRHRVLMPICLLLVAQLVLLVSGLAVSGLPQRLDAASLETLTHTVEARADYLQYDMINRWHAVDDTIASLRALYTQATVDGTSTQELCENSDAYCSFLQNACPYLVRMMRSGQVSGAFLMLRSGATPLGRTEERLPCLYLRDRDPVSSYSSANTDLLLEYAPVSLSSATGIATDANWAPLFSFQPGSASAAFFELPFEAAQENISLGSSALSYWAPPHQIHEDGPSVISYTVPLLASDGSVYGVMGVDILLDYLTRQIPSSEVANGQGAYFLCGETPDGVRTMVALSGASSLYTAQALSGASFTLRRDGSFYEVQADGLAPQVACAKTLTLYANNAFFSTDSWVLYGIEPADTLFGLSRQLLLTFLKIMGIVFCLSIFVAFLIAHTLSRPITRLEQEVRNGILAGRPVALSRTHITELDILAQGVEDLNAEVVRTSGKFSQLFQMSNVRMGAFEINHTKRTLFLSSDFFTVFGHPEIQSSRLDYASFCTLLDGFSPFILHNSIRWNGACEECVYELSLEQSNTIWVQLKTERRGDTTTGFAEDITLESRELKRLEFARDHDPLTGIYNRRAFYQHYQALFEGGAEALGYGALVMLDLDNLKYVNDTYGHDCGDSYIRAAAQALSSASPENALYSRISGDEFLMFFYGYKTEEALSDDLEALSQKLWHSFISLPTGGVYPLRTSAGVAHLPQDSSMPEVLVRYADFAMYKSKRGTKGSFVKFDPEAYARESKLLQGKEALLQLIDQRCVEYYFQPIVSARTGSVLGYEALMRPTVAALSNPADVLALAHREERLADIERITWFCATSSFVEHCRAGTIPENGCLFLNSIANQCLSEADLAQYETEYRPWLSRIVEEHTEEEHPEDSLLARKQEILRRWNARLALDDYGSGYNGETILVQASPNFVKLDMGIVRNINQDFNKQQMVFSLLHYARPRGIGIIAEGVETSEELQTLLHLGVDYLQGYLIARPALVPPVPSAECLRLIHKHASL